MILRIRHLTTYSYNHPVVLEPHCLRLTPRADSYSSLLERQLNITPEPCSVSLSVENDGSMSHWVRFKGETSSLTVESKMTISLIPDKNPFYFLIYPPSCLKLPMAYPSELLAELRPFLMEDNIPPPVQEFAFEVLTEAGEETMNFLVMLAQRIKRDFVYEFRQLGAPHQAEDTLSSRRGSCRDFAILYMAVARAMGLAARFVSGYYFEENPDLPDLHAWVEVYIPAGGWRGIDPSLGLACYGHHIALASGASAETVAPIRGFFLKGHAKTLAAMQLVLEYKYSALASLA